MRQRWGHLEGGCRVTWASVVPSPLVIPELTRHFSSQLCRAARNWFVICFWVTREKFSSGIGKFFAFYIFAISFGWIVLVSGLLVSDIEQTDIEMECSLHFFTSYLCFWYEFRLNLRVSQREVNFSEYKCEMSPPVLCSGSSLKILLKTSPSLLTCFCVC